MYVFILIVKIIVFMYKNMIFLYNKDKYFYSVKCQLISIDPLNTLFNVNEPLNVCGIHISKNIAKKQLASLDDQAER